jgi:hypothetical protein
MVQKIGLRTYEAGHVEAALCEHNKTAVVFKCEELLVHRAHLNTTFTF